MGWHGQNLGYNYRCNHFHADKSLKNSVNVTGLVSDDPEFLFMVMGSARMTQTNQIQSHSVRQRKMTIASGQVDLKNSLGAWWP
jgi:hypothetical protein